VVALSNDVTDTGADDRADARRLHVPALFAAAVDDSIAPAATVRSVYELVRSGPKRLIVLPGSAHGWQLLQDPDGAFTPLAGAVAEWVTGDLS
jgi:pimeloyl-ACP methyl ester carboxylesterase